MGTAQLDPGFLFHHGNGQEFTVGWPVTSQRALVYAFNMPRYFEWDAVLARQLRNRGELLAAAIQSERHEVIAVEKGAEVMTAEAAGCSAARERMLHRL